MAFVLFLDQQIVKNGADDHSKQQESNSNENKPVIDFYKVLKDREVDIPINEADREAIENPSINKEAVSKFILQVGSFSSRDEADSLKAQLALLGLQARIKPGVVDSKTWHRVQLGPFTSEAKLSRAKNLLIEDNHQYVQLKAP